MIPTILSTAPAQEWKGLLGRREDCEPFVLTFNALTDAFNDHALATAGLTLINLEQHLQADRELFAEASRSLAYTDRQLAAALPLLRQAGNDNIPDSAATLDSEQALGRLQEALAAASRALRQPHGDWPALDRDADQIAADAATPRAPLQGEYETAIREAETAHRDAQQAIDAAEAEQRRRRQEQEREEENRRRAATARHASSFASSSGSSFGGSSSGSASSSFSSRSGASRSGW